jgi:hypothetical protein
LEKVEKQQEQAPAAKDPLTEKIDKELGHKEVQDQEVEKSLNTIAAEKLKARLAKYNAGGK